VRQNMHNLPSIIARRAGRAGRLPRHPLRRFEPLATADARSVLDGHAGRPARWRRVLAVRQPRPHPTAGAEVRCPPRVLLADPPPRLLQ
jgi:hypothetical protein